MNTISGSDSGVVEPQEHLARLCRFFYRDATVICDSGSEIDDEFLAEEFWRDVIEPLRIGGCIDGVETVFDFLDPNIAMYCREDPSEEAFNAVISAYTLNISQFLFSWIAFENMAEKLPETNEQSTRKIISYLKRHDASNLTGVESLLDIAVGLIGSKICRTARKAARKTESLHYLHIHLCREFRNTLFHEHKSGIEPRSPDNIVEAKDHPRVKALGYCTQLTLLSIQSVLRAYYASSTKETGLIMSSVGIPDGVTLPEALEVLHLVDQSVVNQGKLEL